MPRCSKVRRSRGGGVGKALIRRKQDEEASDRTTGAPLQARVVALESKKRTGKAHCWQGQEFHVLPHMYQPVARAVELLEGNADSASQAPKSILERSSLDDFLELAFAREANISRLHDTTFRLLTKRAGGTASNSSKWRARQTAAVLDADIDVPIPRRPVNFLQSSMDESVQALTAAELDRLEQEAFLQWRVKLAKFEESGLQTLTPSERNLEYWRQLWRVLERSDIVFQIVDARDPIFFRCRDLEKYVREIHNDKRVVLLLNKADLLPPEVRLAWLTWFKARSIAVLFFSAKLELQRQCFASTSTVSLARSEARNHGQFESENSRAECSIPFSSDGDATSLPDLSPSPHHEFCVESPLGPNNCGPSDGDKSSSVANSPRADSCGVIPRVARDDDTHYAVPSSEVSRHRDKDDFAGLDEAVWHFCGSTADILTGSQLLQFLAVAAKVHSSQRSWVQRTAAAMPLAPGVVFGFIGYPNVGKSSIINSILGHKRVGVSRQPGKTKHFQTLPLPTLGITLCDCPGLVFPQVVATRSHLVIQGVSTLDELRGDYLSAVQLICNEIPDELLKHYHVDAIAASKKVDESTRYTGCYASAGNDVGGSDRLSRPNRRAPRGKERAAQRTKLLGPSQPVGRAARANQCEWSATSADCDNNKSKVIDADLDQLVLLDRRNNDKTKSCAESCNRLNAETLLHGIACARGKHVGGRGAVPHLFECARMVINDFISGRLLHWAAPPAA